MAFDRLIRAIDEKKNPTVAGLDPNIGLIIHKGARFKIKRIAHKLPVIGYRFQGRPGEVAFIHCSRLVPDGADQAGKAGFFQTFIAYYIKIRIGIGLQGIPVYIFQIFQTGNQLWNNTDIFFLGKIQGNTPQIISQGFVRIPQVYQMCIRDRGKGQAAALST